MQTLSKHHWMPYFFAFVLTQIGISREPTNSFRSIQLRNFAYFDSQTNKLYLNFQALEDYKQDKLNFVSVIGCELNDKLDNCIDISEEPLTIINGVSYFLLAAETCHIDILRLLYTLSQSVYISQKLLPNLETNIGKGIDIAQAWDVNNYLYVVSKTVNENQSQLKTAAQTREIRELYARRGEYMKHKEYSLTISPSLQQYFSENYMISSNSISAYDPSVIKENVQIEIQSNRARWYLYEAILRGCTKLFTGPKNLSIKQFHKINNQLLIEELEQRAIHNYQVFSFQILNNPSFSKINHIQKKNDQNLLKDIKEMEKQQKEKQKQKEKEREKQRIKDRQKIKKIRRCIMEPFLEAEQTWIGRSDLFKEKQAQISLHIYEECEKIITASKQKYEKQTFKQIGKDLSQDKSLQVIGQSKYDGAYLNFQNYINNIRQNLEKMVDNSMVSKRYKGKDKPIKNNSDLLANLQTRIEINERKKDGLEQAIKLASKQQDYLNQLVFSIKSKRHPYEIFA